MPSDHYGLSCDVELSGLPSFALAPSMAALSNPGQAVGEVVGAVVSTTTSILLSPLALVGLGGAGQQRPQRRSLLGFTKGWGVGRANSGGQVYDF